MIRGMKENRFNSIPAYIDSQLVAERAIVVPKIIVDKKKI